MKTFLSLLCILLIPSLTLALPSDQKQPAKITADQVEYQHKTGLSIYSGHIKATQGSTKLSADKVVVERNEQHQISKITAIGKRAQYRTTPQKGKQELIAYGDKIVYFPLQAKVTLVGHGEIEQDGNHFSGPHIEYFINEQRILSTPAPGEQTTITLKPMKLPA